jgi:hypothetical protein
MHFLIARRGLSMTIVVIVGAIDRPFVPRGPEPDASANSQTRLLMWQLGPIHITSDCFRGRPDLVRADIVVWGLQVYRGKCQIRRNRQSDKRAKTQLAVIRHSAFCTMVV